MLKIAFLLPILLLSLSCFGQEKILILGDSLTEGHQLDKSDSFPSQLEEILIKEKLNYKVLNGGVSGSTTASGLSRLKWFLKAKPSIIIIALGANDGLRGIKLKESKKNLEDLIIKSKEHGLKVVIAGMEIPPNYGKEYTGNFRKIFPELATKYNVTLIPFLLKDVAGKKELNIEDGIHPNAKGYGIIARTVFEEIKEIL
ncbi:MAG: acyl-CoA thioesterase-1 [Bacteriovoracaceae bacterium]|jgi:acyl-CoA thioesterase-1